MIEHCYVEFTPSSGNALSRIETVYSRLRADLADEAAPRDHDWYSLFSDEELDNYWWPNKNHWEELKTTWGDFPVRFTDKDPNPRGEWDLFSMFEAIAHGEYELLPIEKNGGGVYRLNFNPHAYPFGGTESLQKLLSSLGGKILAVDDGTGRRDLVEQSPDGGKRSEDVRPKPWWRLW